jgi:hypothetical protein
VTTAQACEATAVPDGGTISPTLTPPGVIPPAISIKGPENARECVAEVPDKAPTVGADTGIKNVVGWAMEIIVPAGGAVETSSGHWL